MSVTWATRKGSIIKKTNLQLVYSLAIDGAAAATTLSDCTPAVVVAPTSVTPAF